MRAPHNNYDLRDDRDYILQYIWLNSRWIKYYILIQHLSDSTTANWQTTGRCRRDRHLAMKVSGKNAVSCQRWMMDVSKKETKLPLTQVAVISCFWSTSLSSIRETTKTNKQDSLGQVRTVLPHLILGFQIRPSHSCLSSSSCHSSAAGFGERWARKQFHEIKWQHDHGKPFRQHEQRYTRPQQLPWL